MAIQVAVDARDRDTGIEREFNDGILVWELELPKTLRIWTRFGVVSVR